MFSLNDPSLFKSNSSSKIILANLGSPYGAKPISLYSPELIRNPQKEVNAEYKRPSEWGKRISLSISIWFSLPFAIVVVAHSPTPSMVNIAASLNGEG